MLRFMDYTSIIAESEQYLQKILKIMDYVMEKAIMWKINNKKTKIIVCSRNKQNDTILK